MGRGEARDTGSGERGREISTSDAQSGRQQEIKGQRKKRRRTLSLSKR